MCICYLYYNYDYLLNDMNLRSTHFMIKNNNSQVDFKLITNQSDFIHSTAR